MMIFSSTSATCLRLLRHKVSRSVLLSSSSSYNLRKNNANFASRILQATPKCYSSSSTGSPLPPAPPDPSTFTEEQKGTKESELRIRRYKKIFSTVLFATTLIAVGFARRRKRHELEENFQGCVRIPTDEDFKGSHKEFFRCGVDAAAGKAGCVLPAQILKDGTVKAVKAFKVRPDDVYVASFPKTGTTWVQEIVYLLKNNLDFAKASGKVLEDRFPYLEYPYPGIHSVEKMTSPRLIKTHLPLDFLPQDILSSKVIYITRNPKDTVVSYFHFARMLAFSSFEGSFAHFFKKFLKDELPYTPFFGHLESYTKAAENPNLLIITYEQLTREPAEVIKKIADFLEVPVTAEDISSLVTHTSFQSMEKNPSVNYSHWDELGIRKQQEAPFMRKGKVGDWKNYFSSEMNEDFEAWINANNKAGFQFNYEL